MRFKPRPAICIDCNEPMMQNSGIHRRCAACTDKTRKRRAYLHSVKSGKIKHPGVGRAKLMLKGKKSVNWSGGSIPWQVKNFRKDACECCGSDDRVELHHRDRNITNWKKGNIETLCRTCHMKEHAQEIHICIDCDASFKGSKSKRCLPCRMSHEKTRAHHYHQDYRKKSLRKSYGNS